jgi:hypothetical protein
MRGLFYSFTVYSQVWWLSPLFLFCFVFYAYHQFWKFLLCTFYKLLFPIICLKCNVVLAVLGFWKSILCICFWNCYYCLEIYYCDFVIFFLFCAWQTSFTELSGTLFALCYISRSWNYNCLGNILLQVRIPATTLEFHISFLPNVIQIRFRLD